MLQLNICVNTGAITQLTCCMNIVDSNDWIDPEIVIDAQYMSP